MKKFGNFKAGERGSIAVMSAMLIAAVAAAAGGALDMTRHMEVTQRSQATLDRAVIAAARGIGREGADTNDLEASVTALLDANLTEKSIPFEHTLGDVRLEDGTLTAELDVETDMLFAGVIGLKHAKAQLRSGVRVEQNRATGRDHDIILAVDNTYSMDYNELTRLRAAAIGLVDDLDAASARDGTDIRLGVVPFARYVNVSSFGEAAEPAIDFDNARKNDGVAWQGCVHPYYDARDSAIALSDLLEAGYDFDTLPDKAKCKVSPITPMTDNSAVLNEAFGQIVKQSGGSTYIPSGLSWARRMMEPDNPFVPHPANSEALRTIVLFSDGANALYWVRDDVESDRQTAQMCEAIKADGARIIVVAFALDQSDELDVAAMEVLRGCASGPEYLITAEDREALREAFAETGRQILDGVISSTPRLIM